MRRACSALLLLFSIGCAAPRPSARFERFLPSCPDSARRQHLWAIFQAAETEAEKFAEPPSAWVPIDRVDFGSAGNRWVAERRSIELSENSEDATLFHEMFHAAFHRSALHAGHDERWGEAFADAFRFAAEQELLPPPRSAWAEKLARYSAMTPAAILAQSADPKHDRKYALPASRIVARSGGTMSGLRQLWFELIELRKRTGADVLDEALDYHHEG